MASFLQFSLPTYRVDLKCSLLEAAFLQNSLRKGIITKKGMDNSKFSTMKYGVH